MKKDTTKMKWNSLIALATTIVASGVAFAGPDLGAAEQQATNWHAIIMFVIFVGATLFITKWAAKQTTNTKDFYTAGGGISGFQNGLAIAGDYMSAASFLGISAMVFLSGFDGLLYSLGFMVGWPIVLFLVAERLRNLGNSRMAWRLPVTICQLHRSWVFPRWYSCPVLMACCIHWVSWWAGRLYCSWWQNVCVTWVNTTCQT